MSTPTGTGNGGALFCRGARGVTFKAATLSILSCDMSRNRATSSGGAIFSQVILWCAIRQGGTHCKDGSECSSWNGSAFSFTNTPFLREDTLLYPDSAELTHSTSKISDDGRGWPIMSTGDEKPGVLSDYDRYSGYYGCPSGSLDRCLNLCSANARLPQHDPTTAQAAGQPTTFSSCVRVCRAFCKW